MIIKPYTPQGKTKIILDRAFELIKSVPYKTSNRWTFYRLLQLGYYHNKKDYRSKWNKVCAMARKRRYNGWRPDTLADDTRERISRVGWFASWEDAAEKLPDEIANSINITFDHFYRQEVYVELWFEARAMAHQFEYYTRGIDLVPFGGDPGVDYKFKISKNLENCAKWYGLPLKPLYFGDYDKKGGKIFKVAERDIQAECSAPIEVIHCGLNKEQVEKYDVPENFEKPGEYQWEALEDWQAKEIIEEALKKINLNTDLIEACEREGEEKTDYWREKTKQWVQREIKKK